ncbi:MAG: DUF4907 domain-containing protein [Bacteroidales bacterium]|nr:DUF4907 domain-containing protein [Bacteroidales bacterium]
MIKGNRKKGAVVLITITFILVAFLGFLKYPKNQVFSYCLFISEKGWGYEIRCNNKPFIYQQYIPVLQGNKAFPDKKAARKAAKTVTSRLNNNKPPRLTLKDINDLDLH